MGEEGNVKLTAPSTFHRERGGDQSFLAARVSTAGKYLGKQNPQDHEFIRAGLIE